MARQHRVGVVPAPLVLLLLSLTTVTVGTPAASATSAVPAPSVAPVTGGSLYDVVVSGAYAYATNPSRNEVDVLSLATGTTQAAIFVGSQPRGLDVSADKKTLYVANSGANDISVVDLTLRQEVRRITLPSATSANDRPYSIAVANNGKAFVTTTFSGSGFGGRMVQLDLATEKITDRTDFWHGGSTTEATRLKASADRSHIAIVAGDISSGPVFLYTSASDTFSMEKDLNGFPSFVAIDGTGSTMLVTPGAMVLDQNLHLRATVPGGGMGGAVNAGGSFAYRVQPGQIDVIDLARGLVTASAPLPEDVGSGSGMVALTPDDLTLVALTASGFSVVPVGAAVPVPACTPAPAAFPVVPVCGGPLGDVVVDGSGHAYATNPTRNEVEVVSLATGAVEAPIFVGSIPLGLDLSPDGTKLYVANSGANDVSVVDLVLRKEVARIAVPSGFSSDRPFSIAVANNGKAFVSTTFAGSGFGALLYQIDLATRAVTVRTDFYLSGGTTEATRLRASGDRSRIGIVAGDISSGPVFLYDAATNSFKEKDLDGYLDYVALDGTGSKVLVNTGSFVLDGSLVLRATIPPTGSPVRGVAVSPDGAVGYRVMDSTVEVLDLARGLQVGTIGLPEPVDAGANGVTALTPDARTLVVLTRSGLSIVPTSAKLAVPFTQWMQPSSTPLDGLGTWIAVAVDPVASGTQLPSSYVVGTVFGFAGAPATGSISLLSTATGRYAVFTVSGDDGPHTAAVPFDWQAGYYFPFVYQLGPGQWGAWVYDLEAGRWTPIGVLSLPAAWGKLAPTTFTLALWHAGPAPACASYPHADVLFYPPTGYVGITPATAVRPATNVVAGDCPAQTSMIDVWARYQLGGA